jgi:hypothetical protein
MLRQFSETSPGIESCEENENVSDATRASRLPAIIPGDLPLASLADAIFSVRLFDSDSNWASAKFHVRFPLIMAELPIFHQDRLDLRAKHPVFVDDSNQLAHCSN